MLKELDKSISMSPNFLGGMLLVQAGLSTMEKNMFFTSTHNTYELDMIAQALLDQHWDLHTSQSHMPSAGIQRQNRWTHARPSRARAFRAGDRAYDSTYADEYGEDDADAWAAYEEYDDDHTSCDELEETQPKVFKET